jgi:glycosyltransferase involved in cell wall biosynthesis
MKARISENQTGNSSGIVLSVGMIVKNEEKHLEKCLTALKPLLDAVPSELVITDTGSSDNTVEIARRFTDKVLHFDWVNDFSAARNFGLKECVGDWFMFLDADDIFDEDLSEIIGFFTDRNALSKYKSATYMTKDYTEADGSDWSKFAQSRIVKRVPGLRFKGAIHELLLPFSPPTKHIRTFSHHWGYVFENEEQRQAKSQRNLVPLRAELKKEPNNLRTFLHILNELSGEEKDEVLRDALKAARKQTNNTAAGAVFTLNILGFYNNDEYEKALSSADEFLGLYKGKTKNMFCLDVYAAKAFSLQKSERYEEAVAAFDDYFKLYKLYRDDKLDTTGLGLIPITYCEPEKHETAAAVYENLLFKTGRKKVAFDTSFIGVQDIQVKSKPAPDGEIPASDEAKTDVDENDVKAIVSALTSNSDISDAIREMNAERIGKTLAAAAQEVFNLPTLATKYNEDFLLTDNKNLLFGVLLYETAAGQAGRLPWHERAVLYKNFARYASLYAVKFGEADLLPETRRFGHHMSEAQKALDSGDGEAYIAELEKMQASCESDSMKFAMEFLIEDFKAQ